MIEEGSVSLEIGEGVATVEFFHPKKNSLPGQVLSRLSETFIEIAESQEARVVVLKSRGDGPFCAGASFDELLAVRSAEQGREFFMGFARVILAMIRCPKLIISRIQGKAVGGGVGLISASDYAIAHRSAAVKLSELALGLGPFVVGPCVEKKIGRADFAALSIDTAWRDSNWALDKGMYQRVYKEMPDVDCEVDELARRLAASNPLAMAALKEVFWEGTDHWPALLPQRAAASGRLVLSEFTSNAIAAFRKKAAARNP